MKPKSDEDVLNIITLLKNNNLLTVDELLYYSDYDSNKITELIIEHNNTTDNVLYEIVNKKKNNTIFWIIAEQEKTSVDTLKLILTKTINNNTPNQLFVLDSIAAHHNSDKDLLLSLSKVISLGQIDIIQTIISNNNCPDELIIKYSYINDFKIYNYIYNKDLSLDVFLQLSTEMMKNHSNIFKEKLDIILQNYDFDTLKSKIKYKVIKLNNLLYQNKKDIIIDAF